MTNVIGSVEPSPLFAFLTVNNDAFPNAARFAGRSILSASKAPSRIPLKMELVPSVTIRLGNLYFTIMIPLSAPMIHPNTMPIINVMIHGAPSSPRLFVTVRAR